jgi:hypothetical protein
LIPSTSSHAAAHSSEPSAPSQASFASRILSFNDCSELEIAGPEDFGGEVLPTTTKKPLPILLLCCCCHLFSSCCSEILETGTCIIIIFPAEEPTETLQQQLVLAPEALVTNKGEGGGEGEEEEEEGEGEELDSKGRKLQDAITKEAMVSCLAILRKSPPETNGFVNLQKQQLQTTTTKNLLEKKEPQ